MIKKNMTLVRYEIDSYLTVQHIMRNAGGNVIKVCCHCTFLEGDLHVLTRVDIKRKR